MLMFHIRIVVLLAAVCCMFAGCATVDNNYLRPEDFAWYTTYENIGCSKPNPAYYREILSHLDCQGEDCLMVGNDVDEDMIAAQQAGLSVFLLTDCMVNRQGRAITDYPRGDFGDLITYVKSGW